MQALVLTPVGQVFVMILVFAFCLLVFVLGMQFHHFRTRGTFSPQWHYKQQMKAVAEASFQKQKLMNGSEFQVFRALEQDMALKQRGYRIFAQASLGEVISSASEGAYRAINSKRVDVLIVDKGGYPVLAIEYQGHGHNGATSAQRDAIKKQALGKAGVGYLEIFPDDTLGKLVALVHAQLGWGVSGQVDARVLQQRVSATVR